jgi:tetratricopeptide (TPR) repeat protein
MKKIASGIISLFIVLFLSGCAASLYRQGTSLMQEEKYDEAIGVFQKNLTQNPDDYKTVRDIGIAYEKKDDFDQAITNLLKAYTLAPDDGETILYLGLAYEGKQDYDNALQYYKNYTKLSGFNSAKEAIEGRITLIAKKKTELEVKNAVKNEANINVDSIPDNTIAVLYFQNLGKNKQLDPLQKGITEMIITDLSKVKKLKVVERVKLQKLLDEIQLGQSGVVDPATAPRVGKLLGASTLMNGSFIDLDNDNLRFDVNMTGVKDASKQNSSNMTGSLKEFFKSQKQLTFDLISKLGYTLTDEERESIQIIPTESFLAFQAYSKGLDMEDKGQMQQAAEQYKQAAAIDPGFTEATAKAQSVQAQELGSGDVTRLIQAAAAPTALTQASLIDRLASINTNMTNETIQAKDDHTPYTPSIRGGVAVKIVFVVPTSSSTYIPPKIK